MKRFCIISGHGFMAGFNFENEENEKNLINKIGHVWEYYHNDFRIMFSGEGELKLFGPNNMWNKIYTSDDFCEWLKDIIELKTSTFVLQERSKQIYVDQMDESPLRKHLFKKLIEQAEKELERDKKFIEQLNRLIKDIKEFSI